MSMSKDAVDKFWKVFTVVLGVVVVPLSGWVWNTNLTVHELSNDLGDAEKVIESLENQVKEADGNTKAIISIEKDIEFMKTTLERIERFVTK
jgi:hypothetical protein